MSWSWDDKKNRDNIKKHGISFEDAKRVFDDPLAAIETDPHPHEERFRITGMTGGAIVMVVYALIESADATADEQIRIISARKVDRSERLEYEEYR